MSKKQKDKLIRIRDNGKEIAVVSAHEGIVASVRLLRDFKYEPNPQSVYYDRTPRLFGKTLKNGLLARALAYIVPRRWVDYSVRHVNTEIATVDRLPNLKHTRRIVCAANAYVFKVNGETQTRLVIGARHMDHLMRPHISEIYRIADDRDELYPKQGFIDQWGEYMSRTLAYDLARCNGQIVYDGNWPEGKLYSENLY